MSTLPATPRRSLSTNDWLASGLFAILLMIGLALFVQQILAGSDAPNFSSRSDEPLGALGAARWLEKLGYQLDESEVNTFHIPNGVDVVVMLEPEYVTSDDFQRMNRWVRAGGVLLLAGQGAGVQQFAQVYELELAYSTLLPPLAWAQTPLVASPPQEELATLRPRAYFAPTRNNYLTLYAALDKPTVITFPLGSGRVIAASTAYPFTNAGLTEPGNANLMLNLMTLAPAGATVWFDEWHHGERVQSTNAPLNNNNQTPNPRLGPMNWLRYNPVGQAFLYGGLVILVALLLSGRAFGRPLTSANETLRRPPLAYVQAIATLNRRAGHRTDVLRAYHQRLKKELGQRYRLSPALPDGEFVAQLAKYKPGLDAAALQNLLSRLQNKKITEVELVQLAAEVADWLKQ
ncbi:MAG: DUF4350 domain-containing protein [Chloroflexi bacterium]|nr:DUF4350 domain-containing protein [Chloroflexota bacterium]